MDLSNYHIANTGPLMIRNLQNLQIDKQLREFCRLLPYECRLVLVHLESRYPSYFMVMIDESSFDVELNEILV